MDFLAMHYSWDRTKIMTLGPALSPRTIFEVPDTVQNKHENFDATVLWHPIMS